MNSSTNASATGTGTVTSTNANWGFKTPIQFKVSLRLAGAFGHLWAEGQCEKIDGAWVHKDPGTPAEASAWAEAANANKNRVGSANVIPTPSWESGSGSFGVEVTPKGVATIVIDGVIAVTLTTAGIPAGVRVTTNWWCAWTGRAINLGGAVRSALATLSGGFRGALPASPALFEEAVRLFEADRQFWRSGLKAGTRWWM